MHTAHWQLSVTRTIALASSQIRILKRLNAWSIGDYGKKLRETQRELKAFIDEHSDVLRRDYSREKTYGEAVDHTEKSGIIELTTSNGIKITKFSEHTNERAVERNVSVDDIKDSLKKTIAH